MTIVLKCDPTITDEDGLRAKTLAEMSKQYRTTVQYGEILLGNGRLARDMAMLIEW